MKIGVIGAGRIGKVHIRNISLFVPELTIKTVADPFMNEKTAAYVKQFGIENVTKEADDILNDPEIEAVVIASSTNTHAKFIIESAKAGKNIFCEKPIDYDLNRVHEAIQAAKDAGVQLQIGFCRRFDHNHRAVYDMVKSGKIGQPHLRHQLPRSGAAFHRLRQSFRRYLLRYDDPRFRYGSFPRWR